jgi:anti-sigma regulatory factor (Ser/Thr protein kinase)
MPIPAHGTVAHLAFDASLDALPVLAETLETLAEELGWDAATAMQINLVAEELIVNIVHYGYPDGRPGHIDVWLEASPTAIQLRIEDDGDAFDPFAIDEPDLTLAVEERPIGGLGVHFMRTYTDLQAYQRINGRNRVTLVKHLTP